MWTLIAKAIAKASEQPFSIESTSQITGGDVNQAYAVQGNGRCYFVKINNATNLESFEAEAYSLNTLKATEQIKVPDVVTLGVSANHSFIVLEHLDLKQPSDSQWKTCGQQLAWLHKTATHGQFGWQHDNFIGTTLQPNQWSSNWRQFFAQQRIAWQLQLLSEKSIILGDIDFITQVCHDLLTHHQVSPCLVHGDLWQGNIGFFGKQPVFYDPACYYGDREVDLAMTELFGRFPVAFYQGYQSILPVPDRYETRKHVYNFYHVLNHANLFGGIYIDQAKACLQRLLSFETP